MSSAVLESQLERAERRVQILEDLIESKTRALYEANERLRSANGHLNDLHRLMPCALVVVGPTGRILQVNQHTLDLLGYEEIALKGRSIQDVCPWSPDETGSGGRAHRYETEWRTAVGHGVPVLVARSTLEGSGGPRGDVLVAVDLRERKRFEVELRYAQKLESIGQLASGVAHEINTPMQFIGDNVHFLQQAFDDLLSLVGAYERLAQSVADMVPPQIFEAAREAADEADLAYLRERAPGAFQRTLDGVERVSTIVSAMKAFSHPSDEMGPTDINEVIATTLTVARNEYKYVARVETDLGDVPPVTCNVGDLNQVVLNLVVNAAHAIADVGGEAADGVITVRSYCDDGQVVVSVSDTGTGIPERARDRIFEPFFTTKAVGSGTGQGLSMAYAIVVDRHRGGLTFETEVGRGTTFFVKLPLEPTRSGSREVG